MVEIPGLVVQVMEPATHLAILSTSLPYTVPFQVNVMMMCGCQIDIGQPWIPSDFAVTAAVGPVGQSPQETVVLTFPDTAPSLFTGSLAGARRRFRLLPGRDHRSSAQHG